MKHEWRKKEKQFYLPKSKPEHIQIPNFKFITVKGEGNPNTTAFSDCISALYSLSYAIKMTAKKLNNIPGHMDYTVYPLEGVWSLNKKAQETFDGTINKDDFVYTLMIRQPDFVSFEFFQEMVQMTEKKKPNPVLSRVNFEQIEEGNCVQMLHLGSYDDEPASFAMMEHFAEENNLNRISKIHREIYLSDFRKVSADKLKTVLRFNVEPY